MNNVLIFPDKVFPHWEGIAQILRLYLTLLGATKEEAEGTIERLQARWNQLEPPLPTPVLHLMPALRPDRARLPFEPGPMDKSLHQSRHWKTESARQLLDFSKIDFDLSQQL